MKLVTLLVESIGEPDEDDDRRVVPAKFTTGYGGFWVPQDIVVAVEDAPEPLPAESGVRFWGRAPGVVPQWFFSVHDGEEVTYVSQNDDQYNPRQAVSLGLVRLSDPDVTP